MKRILFLLALSFLGFTSFASHYMGGSVSWEKTNSGQFIFEVKIFRECGTGSATYVSNILNGPNGSITLSTDTIIDISPNCLSCGTVAGGSGAIALHVMKSAPISLQGTPPASGWSFYWVDNARPPSVLNTSSGTFFIESKMYPGYSSSSPSFVEGKAQVLANYNNTYSVQAIKGTASDSLHYKFKSPMQAAGTGVVYNLGYSASSPFPSSLTNPANGPISIDGNTGLISYDIQAATSGYYSLGVAVEQWHNGVLVSEIFKEVQVAYSNNSSSNAAPAAVIDTSLYSDIIQTGPYSYKTFKNIGDSVEFNITSSDFDINPGTFLPQDITFLAKGSALGMPWGTTGMYNVTPSINPVAPQTGFVNSSTNIINFYWTIANEHHNPNNTSHFFTFTFKDNQCFIPGQTNITLQVVVRKAVSITADTLNICSGDSIQLAGMTNNGVYSWSPASGLSNTTISNPMASPSASGYYYLSNGNGDVDSVYVQVTQPGTIDLAFANGKLELTDTNGTSNRIWYYNGVPFYYPYDTLTPFGFGDYWVKAQDGPCALISNTFNINTGHSFSVFDPNNGGYNGTNMPVSGSIGATFKINQSTTINSVTIVGLEDLHKRGTGYDLNLKIYDANQIEVFSKDMTLNPQFFGPLNIPVGYAVTANADYTVAVTGDTAYSFKLYENVSYPATPHHNGITVTGSYEGAGGQFPNQPSNYLLPFTINTDAQVVGLEEKITSSIEIYPNPAMEAFTIDGLKGESEIQLMDLNGKLIVNYNTKENSFVIERGSIAAGVYFIKVSGGNSSSIQKVMFK